MAKNPKGQIAFGEFIHRIRIEKRIGLREICRKVDFDPSNWSKVERGRIAPPSDSATLTSWAKALGLTNEPDIQRFVDSAMIAQGIIPEVPDNSHLMKLLPAFFRTLRNNKPSKQELDALMELLKQSL